MKRIIGHCRLFAVLSFLLVIASAPVQAQSENYDYLYQAKLVRAAPGQLFNLIEMLKEWEASGFYEAVGERAPFIMRHSQGDQWDLFLLYGVDNLPSLYSPEKIALGDSMAIALDKFNEAFDQMVAFEEDLFAWGPPIDDVSKAFAANDFYHVEMFNALPGKHKELVTEREMENEYLVKTDQRPNMIWVREMGSDFDSFTIGFYPSIVEFAAPSNATDQEAEAAAIAAGFAGRSFIGFYLRELISAHHDTLAVSVR